MTWQGTIDGWNVQITEKKDGSGTIYEYQQKFTLTGAAQNLDLTVPFPFLLNNIIYFSNDATAKSFTEQIFTGSADTTTYKQIMNLVGDTNQPNHYAGDVSDYYSQQPIMIRTAISASTNGKTLTKKIVLTKVN
jgi:hypothetical protein